MAHVGGADERRRQHVLAAVLLPVIEAACGVDGAGDRRATVERPIDDVDHLAGVVLEDVHDTGVAEPAGVEGLAAGGRIEGRLRQPQRKTPGCDAGAASQRGRGPRRPGARVCIERRIARQCGARQPRRYLPGWAESGRPFPPRRRVLTAVSILQLRAAGLSFALHRPSNLAWRTASRDAGARSPAPWACRVERSPMRIDSPGTVSPVSDEPRAATSRTPRRRPRGSGRRAAISTSSNSSRASTTCTSSAWAIAARRRRSSGSSATVRAFHVRTAVSGKCRRASSKVARTLLGRCDFLPALETGLRRRAPA